MTVTVNTPARLVFTAGTITVGGVDVGATMEGNVFRLEKEISEPHFHGVRGPLAGGMFMSSLVPYLETTLAEITGVHIGWAIPGVTVLSNASSETISGFVPGCIATTAFKNIILTVTKCDGKTVVLTVKNAIMVDAPELSFNDEGDPVTMKMVWKGCYAAANPTVAPFTIVNNI